MADIEIIKGADNGNPPDTLRQMYPKVNRNFQRINSELTGHISSKTAHKAENITYTGQVPGDDVKEAIDNVNGRISEIVAQGGDDNTEIVDARGGFTTLGDRLNEMGVEFDTKKINVKIGNDEPLTVNQFPPVGGLVDIIDGDSVNPTTRGMESTVHIQRTDKSVLTDNGANIIPTVYVQTKRKKGGVAWLHGFLSAIEDESDTGASQTVAVAGMAYANNDSMVWGIYGDAWRGNANSTITGGEFDATNAGGDCLYNYVNPVAGPYTCGVWVYGGGPNINSFGLGVGGNFDCAVSLISSGTYGIDIQGRPGTLINFKDGAKAGGGIGLNTGAFADYGTAGHQAAIHLWKNRIGYGLNGFGYMAISNDETKLEFWYAGQRRGYIDLTGTDHAL